MKLTVNYFVTVAVSSFIILFCEAMYNPRAAACAPPALENGRVRSRQRARLVRFMCQPGYEIVGNKYATCNGGEWDVPAPVCVRVGCPPLREINNGIQVQSHRGAYVSFYCNPRHQLNGSPVLYCDGVKWNSSMPVCVDTTVRPSLTCDFEKADLCGWKNDEYHDFDWRRYSKKTPSAFMNTGPSHDHTLGPAGLGHYMYVESTGRTENDKARLISPIFDAELLNNGCFSFYYHMFGKTTGTLRVYVKPVTVDLAMILEDKDTAFKKFEKSGNQGDIWFREIIDLPNPRENFQIVIEGVRGTSFTSDIAIDDLALLAEPELCRKERSSMKPVSPMPTMPLDSCSARCGNDGVFSPMGDMFECSCVESCFDEESCCADYRDLCDTDTNTSADPVNVTDSTPVHSEPAPQTMKLVASTPYFRPHFTYYARSKTPYARSTTKTPPTSTTTTTTATTTTTTKAPITAHTRTKATSMTTASLRTMPTLRSPSTTKRTTTTTAKATTSPKLIIMPTIVFRTTTREPFNATGLLGRTTISNYNAVTKSRDYTKTTSNKVTVHSSTLKSTKTVAVTTKQTSKPTVVHFTKTTVHDGIVPISRMFENHNTYHEEVRKEKENHMKTQAFKAKTEQAGRSSVGATLAGAAAAACLLVALALLAIRGRWLRDKLKRMRARGHERSDDVRYLTADDHLNFE